MQYLKELQTSWHDTPEYHQSVHESFCALVNESPTLKKSRDFVEANAFGFGERSFWWLWKLILQELPDNPKLLEIGVFKAATLSLWKLLRSNADVYGITPLNTAGGVWESDYADDIKHIHEINELPQPTIIQAYSESAEAISAAQGKAPYQVVYVDGSHIYQDALLDLNNYAPMVSKGGFLVIDDAANYTHQPFGYFQGIQTVSDALQDWLKTEMAKDFEFISNVVHIMVYRRK